MSERGLALEVIAVLGIETINGVRENGWPRPSRYVGTLIVYGALAGLAAVGPEQARLAAAFGAVFLLAIILSPDSSGTPKGVTAANGLLNAARSPQIPTGGSQ